MKRSLIVFTFWMERTKERKKRTTLTASTVITGEQLEKNSNMTRNLEHVVLEIMLNRIYYSFEIK